MRSAVFNLVIVDTNSNEAAVLSRAMYGFGYRALVVSESEIKRELANHCKESTTTVLLVDYLALKKSPDGLIQRLKDALPGQDCVAIVTSKHDTVTGASEAFAAGADDYFSLTSSIGELHSRMQHLVDVKLECKYQDQGDTYQTHALLSASLDGLLLIDETGLIVSASPSMEQLFGYQTAEYQGLSIDQLLLTEIIDKQGERKTVATILRDDSLVHKFVDRVHNMTAVRRDGNKFKVQLRMHMMEQSAKSKFIVAIKSSADSRQIDNSRLDYVTGIPNRSYFYSVLTSVMSSDEREEHAVIYVDVARFRDVNNSYGSNTADNLLRLISFRIKRLLGSESSVARLGNDEFASIVKLAGTDTASILQKLSADLQRPFIIGAHRYHLDFCLAGILLEEENNCHEVIDKLLSTLRLVKCDPACDWAVHQQEHSNEAQDKQAIADLFIECLENDDNVELYYQPLIDLRHFRIVGAEALMRWHRDGVPISPMKFLPAIENIRAAQDVGLWVLKRGCSDAQKWIEAGVQDCQVSVNVFPSHLESGRLTHDVKIALEESGLSPSMLNLEITESRLIEHFERCRQEMNKVSELGVDFALDDFGTGYSSLSYLHKLNFSKLKIDKVFVQEMHKYDSRILVESILSFARKMGLLVVAEGIETIQHERDLTYMDCPIGQGFLYGKPMPLNEFIEWSTKWKEEFQHTRQANVLLHPGRFDPSNQPQPRH